MRMPREREGVVEDGVDVRGVVGRREVEEVVAGEDVGAGVSRGRAVVVNTRLVSWWDTRRPRMDDGMVVMSTGKAEGDRQQVMDER